MAGLLAKDYRKGDEMRVMISRVDSRTTNFSYNYYDLGFERAPRTPEEFYASTTKQFGETLRSEVWGYSPYTVWLNPSDVPNCLVVAYDVPYEAAVMNRLNIVADQNFEYKLMIDDLPSATVYRRDEKGTTNSHGLPQIEYDYGIPVAHKVIKPSGPISNELMLMNHLQLTVETHTTDNGAIRIVGFEVEAMSIDWGDKPCRKPKDGLDVQLYGPDKEVSYTYQVVFKKSDLLWAHRFDHYAKLGNDRVHHL